MRVRPRRRGPDATPPPEVRILLDGSVPMSRGKACAQAVHAALEAFGVPHGRVVVLTGSSEEVAAMDVVVRDAGLTEIPPGTTTAGATVVREPSAGRWFRRRPGA